MRQRENVPIPLPQNLGDLQIPPRYSVTLADEPFFLAEFGQGNNRGLIFSTRANLQMLSRSRHWYADGTFKTAPMLFEQLYTIHGTP